MFNATDLCTYGKKLLYNFKELISTKNMIKKLKDDGLEDSEIWVGNKGNTELYPQGSWIHYQLAILLCKWVSVSFEKQIRKYIHTFIDDEIILIGEIENNIPDDVHDIDIHVNDIPENVNTISEITSTKDATEIILDNSDNSDITDIIQDLSNDTRVYFKEFKLILPNGNEYLIPVRQDGYINATVLCKLAGKLFADYNKTKQTKDFLNTISNDMNIIISDLIVIKKGGNPKLQGTWVHRRVAYNLTQWVFPEFANEVTKILDQLFVNGKVELNKNSSDKLLIAIKRLHTVEDELEIVKKERDEERRLRKERDKTIDKMKYKRTCHKFKEGPVVYVFKTFGRHKIGKVGKIDTNEEKFGNLNERLANHRCMDPNLIINYIIYTPQYDLLEKCILQRFEDKRIDLNHEFVDDLSIEEIYDGIKCIITCCGIQATFEEQSEIDKYNEKIQ
jgi:hypothetical protein